MLTKVRDGRFTQISDVLDAQEICVVETPLDLPRDPGTQSPITRRCPDFQRRRPELDALLAERIGSQASFKAFLCRPHQKES